MASVEFHNQSRAQSPPIGHAVKWKQGYLVDKPLRAAGMSADNVRGWVIVRKMNIWQRSEALRANMKFEENLSAKDIISEYTGKPERDLFIL